MGRHLASRVSGYNDVMLDVIERIDLYLFIFAALLAVGSSVYSWLVGRSTANRQMIDELTANLTEHARRLDLADGQLQGLPALAKRSAEHDQQLAEVKARLQDLPLMRQEMSEMHRRIDEVAVTTANINGQMTRVNRSLDLLTQHLLKS